MGALAHPGRFAPWALICAPSSVTLRPAHPTPSAFAGGDPEHPRPMLHVGYRWATAARRPERPGRLLLRGAPRPEVIERLVASRWRPAFRWDPATGWLERWEPDRSAWRPANVNELPVRSARRHPSPVWDRHSRARLVRRLSRTDWHPMLANPGASPALVTLTYPGDWLPLAPSAAAVYRHLKAFRQRLGRALGRPVVGVVKLEFAPRYSECRTCRRALAPRPGCDACARLAGVPADQQFAPHLHLLLCLPPVLPLCSGRGRSSSSSLVPTRTWVSRTWYEVVGSADPRHLRAGTQVKFVDAPLPAVAQYFVRHGAPVASKQDQHVAPQAWLEGSPWSWWRVWGLPEVTVEHPIDDEMAVEIHRTAERWWRQRRSAHLRDQAVRRLVAQAQRRLGRELSDHTPEATKCEDCRAAYSLRDRLRDLSEVEARCLCPVDLDAVEQRLGRPLSRGEVQRLMSTPRLEQFDRVRRHLGDLRLRGEAARGFAILYVEELLGRRLHPAEYGAIVPPLVRGEPRGRRVHRRQVDPETGEIQLVEATRPRRDPRDVGYRRERRRVVLDARGDPQTEPRYRRVYRRPRHEGLAHHQVRVTLLAPDGGPGLAAALIAAAVGQLGVRNGQPHDRGGDR